MAMCVALMHLAAGIAGSVDVPPDLMEELLQAADQYMLGSLKRLCEIAIADTLTVRRRTLARDCQELGLRSRVRSRKP